MVFRQGQDCPGVFIVDTGMVRVFKTSPAGKEHVLHMVSPGQTFAEVAAIGNFACPAHAEAVEPTRCVLIPVDRFRDQMVSDHAVSGNDDRHVVLGPPADLADGRPRAPRRAGTHRPLPAGVRERTPTAWCDLPSLKRHVASHLNLTSETLSRTLSRLIEAGLVVEHDKNRVELCDPRQLRAVSEGKYPEI